MKFDKTINNILKEDLSRKERIDVLKNIPDVSPVILVFVDVGRYVRDDNTGKVDVNEPWRIATTYVGAEMYREYFNMDDSPYYGVEMSVIRDKDIRMHLNELNLVFAFWPKKEGEYWYRKMELIQGEEYIADDNESVVIEPEGDSTPGWTREDVRSWKDWVRDWVYELD